MIGNWYSTISMNKYVYIYLYIYVCIDKDIILYYIAWSFQLQRQLMIFPCHQPATPNCKNPPCCSCVTCPRCPKTSLHTMLASVPAGRPTKICGLRFWGVFVGKSIAGNDKDVYKLNDKKNKNTSCLNWRCLFLTKNFWKMFHNLPQLYGGNLFQQFHKKSPSLSKDVRPRGQSLAGSITPRRRFTRLVADGWIVVADG